MSEELVSVVMPTCNRPFIMVKRAIESVLAQTYTAWELIIVDDNTENCPFRSELQLGVKTIHDQRIVYFQHEQNKGACAARNTGINLARGSFIAFLDDDDEWLPEKLDMQMPKFREGENVGLVYCSNKVSYEGRAETVVSHRGLLNGYVFDALIQKNFIGSTSFVVLRKEVFETCGLFDVEMAASQDYELWLRVVQQYEVRYVDVPLVIYHVHDYERISSSPERKIAGSERIMKMYEDYLVYHKSIYAEKIYYLLKYYPLTRGLSESLKLWRDAFLLDPSHLRSMKELVKIFGRMGKHIR